MTYKRVDLSGVSDAEILAEIRRRTRSQSGVCRVCGCTDVAACPGGCAWVDRKHTLCTACA